MKTFKKTFVYVSIPSYKTHPTYFYVIFESKFLRSRKIFIFMRSKLVCLTANVSVSLILDFISRGFRVGRVRSASRLNWIIYFAIT